MPDSARAHRRARSTHGGDPRHLSRRRLLGLGAVGLGLPGGLALGAGTAQLLRGSDLAAAQAGTSSALAASPVATLTTPSAYLESPVRASVDGLLDTMLTARRGPTTAAGHTFTALTYDGLFPGPTLRVRPGDTLRIALVNELDKPSNLHVHGMHVSPRDNGDNVFLHIMPGETFNFEHQIPLDHPAGLYWYHPHLHGDTDEQVAGGLVGAIVVEGEIDDLPGIAGVPERLLVLQSTEFGPEGQLLTPDQQQTDQLVTLVNGALNPALTIRPGETQRWRILNGSADTFLNLHLDGHQLHQIGSDGNPLGAVWSRDEIFLSPGERAEILVQAGAPGLYALRSLAWGEGFQAQPEVLVATFEVAGETVAPAPLPTDLIPFEDLSQARIDRQRIVVFEEPSQNPFTVAIDGKVFDPNRVDQTVILGDTEEWVLRNTSPDWHPFHIHVNDFQVVAVNGEPQQPHGGEDTVAIPAGGELTIRTRFRDFTGKYVYHCHILGHEDAGMMGVIEVIERNANASPAATPVG